MEPHERKGKHASEWSAQWEPPRRITAQSACLSPPHPLRASSRLLVRLLARCWRSIGVSVRPPKRERRSSVPVECTVVTDAAASQSTDARSGDECGSELMFGVVRIAAISPARTLIHLRRSSKRNTAVRCACHPTSSAQPLSCRPLAIRSRMRMRLRLDDAD